MERITHYRQHIGNVMPWLDWFAAWSTKTNRSNGFETREQAIAWLKEEYYGKGRTVLVQTSEGSGGMQGHPVG